MMIDFDKELHNFSHKFLGYGNLSSPLWFIGMEEGGGNSKEEIASRIKAWINLGRDEVCDIFMFHIEIGDNDFFIEKPKIQKTWNKLIRLQLGIESISPTTNDVRDFQRDKLGRLDSKNALIELMPLPSPGINIWHYDKFSKLPFLRNRATYFSYFLDKRVSLLREKIFSHKPKMVVFYSFSYLEHWQTIASVPLVFNANLDCYSGTSEGVVFLVIKHPTSRLKTGYIEKIADHHKRT